MNSDNKRKKITVAIMIFIYFALHIRHLLI